MIISDTPDDAFSKLSLDIVVNLPPNPHNYKYLLTMQDNLTKFGIAVPLVTADTISIADAVARQVITKFGCPKSILTDQGANFMSNLMKKFARIFKIKKYNTSAYHPQSNGSLERSHHVLVEYLKHFINENQDNWPELLDFCLFSYNTSVHQSTNFTPFELIFGHKARLPSSLLYNDTTGDVTYDDYHKNLTNTLNSTRKFAHDNLHRAKEKSKGNYDKNAKTREFKIGDYVYLKNETKKSKFDDNFSGPYKVLDVLDTNNIKIQIGTSRKIIHTDRVKPVRQQNNN